jgi:hypothetical protein
VFLFFSIFNKIILEINPSHGFCKAPIGLFGVAGMYAAGGFWSGYSAEALVGHVNEKSQPIAGLAKKVKAF